MSSPTPAGDTSGAAWDDVDLGNGWLRSESRDRLGQDTAPQSRRGMLSDEDKLELIRERAAELGRTPSLRDMGKWGDGPFAAKESYFVGRTWAETCRLAGLETPAEAVARWIAGLDLDRKSTVRSRAGAEEIGYTAHHVGQVLGDLADHKAPKAAEIALEGRSVERWGKGSNATVWGVSKP